MGGMPRIETVVGECCMFAESGFMNMEYSFTTLDGMGLEPVPVVRLVCR